MADCYDLTRFVDAQNAALDQVRAELRAGRKQCHWMWFIFPQLAGLGHSPMAVRFAITSRAEGEAYIEHVLLGPRLRQCTELVNQIEHRNVFEIFGHPDDLKFRSSMTLFALATSDNSVFLAALDKYFGGEKDSATLALLGA